MALTKTQRQALGRRTTPTSKSRLLASIRGAKPASSPAVLNPSDYFVPAIDIARRQLGRNYGDTMQDVGIQRQQGTEDFALGQADIARTRGQGLADIGTSRTRSSEDYQNALQSLQRRYGQQAQNQTEAAYAQGVGHGGTLRAAAQKRAENLALDRAPIDTSFTRGQQDLSTQEQRLNERSDLGLGDLARSYERGFGSQGTNTLAGQRAGRDYPISQYDLDLQNIQAAQDAGVVPPAAPRAPASGPSPGPGWKYINNRWVAPAKKGKK